MTTPVPVLALDTSAYLARYLDSPARAIVLEAIAAADIVCASELVLVEAEAAAAQLDLDRDRHERLRAAMYVDWRALHRVPLDAVCLDTARRIASAASIKVVDALHLAAADRLPRPTGFVTFDANQLTAAMSLGFEVIST